MLLRRAPRALESGPSTFSELVVRTTRFNDIKGRVSRQPVFACVRLLHAQQSSLTSVRTVCVMDVGKRRLYCQLPFKTC